MARARTDAELGAVLRNWHVFTDHMARERPGLAELRALLRLEVARGEAARANVLDRLRGAVVTARSRASRAALRRAVPLLRRGRRVPPPVLEDLGL